MGEKQQDDSRQTKQTVLAKLYGNQLLIKFNKKPPSGCRTIVLLCYQTSSSSSRAFCPWLRPDVSKQVSSQLQAAFCRAVEGHRVLLQDHDPNFRS